MSIMKNEVKMMKNDNSLVKINNKEKIVILMDIDNIIKSFKESIPGFDGAIIDFREMKKQYIKPTSIAFHMIRPKLMANSFEHFQKLDPYSDPESTTIDEEEDII